PCLLAPPPATAAVLPALASSSLSRLSDHLFFSHGTPPTEIYTLSLHDALPISDDERQHGVLDRDTLLLAHALEQAAHRGRRQQRSEEHTSELQSRFDLVCRLLLEKKKKKKATIAGATADGARRRSRTR